MEGGIARQGMAVGSDLKRRLGLLALDLGETASHPCNPYIVKGYCIELRGWFQSLSRQLKPQRLIEGCGSTLQCIKLDLVILPFQQAI